MRKLAKKIKADHELALSLWETGNIDARSLAILLMTPKSLSSEEMDRMGRSVTFTEVGSRLSRYVGEDHPDKESLREAWMTTDVLMAARTGWSRTAERIEKSPDGMKLESHIPGDNQLQSLSID